MERRDTLRPPFSIAFVCCVAGVLTVGVMMVVYGYLLDTDTYAGQDPTEIRSASVATDSSDGATVSTVGQDEDETAADPLIPSKLRIPRIDVNADVEHVGVTDDGRMDSPAEWENVAWFKYGFFPGAAGNAVIAGHLDSETGPAIFAQLHLMEPGDEIFVTGEDGEQLTFVVTEVESVPADEAPLDRIFGESSEQHLNLITCEGHFDSSLEDYDHRLIVYSTLAES